MAIFNGKSFFNRFERDDSQEHGFIPSSVSGNGDFDSLLYSWIDYSQVNITPAVINSVLSGVRTGYVSDQAALIEAIVEKEPVIAAHLQTRNLALLSLPYRVTGGTKAHRDEILKILNNANIYGLLQHLMDAVPTGYAGAVIDWGKGAGTINGFKYVTPTNWNFDESGNPAIVLDTGVQKSLGDYHENQFVFHEYHLKTGVPATGGLVRCLVWMYLFKTFSQKFKMRFLERYGTPFLITKIKSTDFANTETRTAIKNALRRIGADGVGITTEGTEVTPLSAGAQGPNASFQEWIGYIDTVYTILILGQLASSSEATGMSNGQIQENVRHDLLAGDAKSLEMTITNHIVRPLGWFKYRSEDFRFKIEYEPKENLKEKLEIVKGIQSLGREVDDDYLLDTFGVPFKKKEKALRKIKADNYVILMADLPLINKENIEYILSYISEKKEVVLVKSKDNGTSVIAEITFIIK